MKIFSVIFVAAIVAITIGRCRAEFLLVQVDDVAAKGNFYIHQGSIWGVMIRIYEFLKAQDQTIPQKHMKLKSLLDREFVTKSHVAAAPAIHVHTNASPSYGKLLKQVRFKNVEIRIDISYMKLLYHIDVLHLQ